MLKGKFVVHRTTSLTGKPVIYFAATMALVSSAFAPVTAHAQAASDIYKKMSDVYAYAKSYQGTITRAESGKTPDGKSASQTVTVKVMFKAPNKYNVTNTRSVTVAGKNQTSTQMMVTDGKALYMFSAAKKAYQRGQIQNENMLSKFFALLNPANGFSLLPETTVNGRAAFALKPNLPSKGTPEQLANAKKVKIALMIDKKTFEFLKMTINGPAGTLTQTVSGQAVNGNLPDSLFAWTPPAGYKEVKTPPPGAPQVPGAPGAPGQ